MPQSSRHFAAALATRALRIIFGMKRVLECPGVFPQHGRLLGRLLGRLRAAGRCGKTAAAVVASALVALSACSPALNWRDVRPEGAAIQMQFPCKPNGQSRDLSLAGKRVNLALHACAAGGMTWGLAVADVADPALVGPALSQLATSAAVNLGTAAGETLPLRVSGATPNEAAGRRRLTGKLPDGQAVQMQMAVFTRGTLVYQASVLGERVTDEAAQTFFDAARL